MYRSIVTEMSGNGQTETAQTETARLNRPDLKSLKNRPEPPFGYAYGIIPYSFQNISFAFPSCVIYLLDKSSNIKNVFLLLKLASTRSPSDVSLSTLGKSSSLLSSQMSCSVE